MDISILLFILASAVCCQCANILYVIPFTSKSHYIMLRPIGLELARRGHNVTVFTAFKEKDHAPTYHQVMADDKKIWEVSEGGRPNVFTMVDISEEEFYAKILWGGGLASTEVALGSKPIQDFLKQDHKFDLVISEMFFQEANFVLAHKYRAPLALVTTFGNCMRNNIIMRNPLQLATVLNEFVMIKEPNSFLGRLRNFYFAAYEYFWYKVWYIQKQEELAKKYIKNLPEPVPSLEELQKNASLFLMNGHYSFDTPAAYLPNFVEIGGIHLTHEFDPLPKVCGKSFRLKLLHEQPLSGNKVASAFGRVWDCRLGQGASYNYDRTSLKDLADILNNSKQGVIYMSFGSNVHSSELPLEKKKAFLNVFRRLKYTVMWKWEEEHLEGKPDNLVIRKWLPQKEILAHPNVKVFISHGGLIGTQEAVFHGVSIVGIPIYADQYNNLLQAQDAGMGRILQYHDINEENLESALRKVLEDDSYRAKAKELSIRFQDRPFTALQTAMYWIEYVIRNKGADYMKNPARNLSFIEYHMLDVYAFFLAIALAFVFVIVKVVKYFVKKETIVNKKTKRS